MPVDSSVSRRKSEKNSDLERYVERDRRGYVRYKHPKMDKPRAFGKDVAAANEVARLVNAQLSGQQDIAQSIIGQARASCDFDHVADRFMDEYVPTLKWAASTLRENSGRLAKFRTAIGQNDFQSLDVLDLSNAIDQMFSGDGRRQARNLLIHVYRFAIGKGLRKGTNAAEEVLRVSKSSRVRCRIANLQHYQAIYEHALPMVQDAMDLSLITLQGRLELCNMRLKHDESDILRVVRQKTSERTDKAYIEIEVGPDLRKVLTRCKITAMRYGSPFMLNHPVRGHRSPNKEHRTQVLPAYLSRKFTEAVNACGLYDQLPSNERPTLHEVRSLGGRIYEAMGRADQSIQELYGHAKPETTAGYLAGDTVQWIRTPADMDMSAAALAKVRE